MQSQNTKIMPGWTVAYDLVRFLIPIASDHITPTRSCITPTAVLHCAELSNFRVELGTIPNWQHHCDIGLYSKLELFDLVFASVSNFSGEVILITDDCFPISVHEPFVGKGMSLREFLMEAPFIFDGDAVFLWPVPRRISVLHHEGRFAHIHCRLTQQSS